MGELCDLLEVFSSDYWDDHYVFGKKSKRIKKKTGVQATAILLINAVIPVMFVYGKSRGINDLCERALDFLDQTEPEKNIIINEWKNSGITAESAFYSQALLQLRNSYCRNRRCLDCIIGNRLIMYDIRLMNNDELLLEP